MRFLVAQIILILVVLALAVNGEYNLFTQMSTFDFDHRRMQTDSRASEQNFKNLWLLAKAIAIGIGGLVAFFIMWLPLIMLSYNMFLISTNQTSYEIDRPNKCDYFDGVPKNSSKFDEGVIENWKDFFKSCWSGNQFKKWKISKEPVSNCCRSFCFCCINENGGCCCD
jgi:hypothetical protein